MTDTAVEDDQADAPELSSRDQHLADWLEAMAAADKLHRQVTVDELAEEIPALEAALEKAAKALGEAYEAKRGPERDIAGLDEQIARADSELAAWQSKVEHGDVAARVEARRWVDEWETELAALRQKREFAQAQLLPLLDTWNKARTGQERADTALEGRKLNATPAFAYYGAGQKTAAYAMRFGLALEPVLRDRDHPEHDAAVEFMLHLCRTSGFRTEDYSDVLPSDAEQARRSWDQLYADPAAHPLEPVPSGQDLLAMDKAGILNAALQDSPSRIEDYRSPNAVPRNQRVAEYRQVPTARDLGIR